MFVRVWLSVFTPYYIYRFSSTSSLWLSFTSKRAHFEPLKHRFFAFAGVKIKNIYIP